MCHQFTQEIFEVFRCLYLTFYMKYKLHKNTPFQNILRFTNLYMYVMIVLTNFNLKNLPLFLLFSQKDNHNRLVNFLRFYKNKDKTRFFISLTGPEASTSLTTQLFFYFNKKICHYLYQRKSKCFIMFFFISSTESKLTFLPSSLPPSYLVF